MASTLRVEGGTLLAAWPDLMDPNFMHSVVLMCEHTDEGAYGLITNQLTNFTLGELLSEHEHLAGSDFPVHMGGPVGLPSPGVQSTMQFMHAVPDAIPGGIELDGGIWLGGEIEHLAQFVTLDPEKARVCVRVFLGYSGWGAGQLDGELATGSWIPAPPHRGAVFGPAGEATWRRVVRSSGRAGAELESQPPDVSWN